MNYLRRFYSFLKEDTWPSWIVSIILIIIVIKFIFFPFMSLVTGAKLPLVVIESCSMYHESSFDNWWDKNVEWYTSKSITKEKFSRFPYKNGLDKGDIIFVWDYSTPKQGDVIIFNAPTYYPIIHRLISSNPLSTKGDHNTDQLLLERDIDPDAIIGKAVARLPYLGWIKLIFYEPFRDRQQRGLCP